MTCINYLLWYKACYIFFSLAKQRFIFCFYRPGIQEQRPHELLVKPSARAAVTGTRWSTCKATHMDIVCPCSLLPHGQRQQFLKSPIIHSHRETPPLNKWSEKESTERCPSVSIWTRRALTATCCCSHMSTEWESTPQSTAAKRQGRTHEPLGLTTNMPLLGLNVWVFISVSWV